MIRTLLTALAITVFMLFGSARSAHADTKIAIVDVDRVASVSTWFKAKASEAAASRDKQLEPLKKSQADLLKLSTALDKEAGTLKADELKRRRDDLERKQKALVDSLALVDKQYQEALAKARADLVSRVKAVAAAVVKEGKYDYCLDAAAVFAGPSGADATNYFATRVDAMK
jgi:Skp family chaperone for outer membrane proteins